MRTKAISKKRITCIAVAIVMAITVFGVLTMQNTNAAAPAKPKNVKVTAYGLAWEGGIEDAAYDELYAKGSWKASSKVDKYEYKFRFYKKKTGKTLRKKDKGTMKWKKNKKYSKKTPERTYVYAYKYGTVAVELKVRAWKGKAHSGWVTAKDTY